MPLTGGRGQVGGLRCFIPRGSLELPNNRVWQDGGVRWWDGVPQPGTPLLQMVVSPQTRAHDALSQQSQQSLRGKVGADKPHHDTQAMQ